jgi:hypothetical protein
MPIVGPLRQICRPGPTKIFVSLEFLCLEHATHYPEFFSPSVVGSVGVHMAVGTFLFDEDQDWARIDELLRVLLAGESYSRSTRIQPINPGRSFQSHES